MTANPATPHLANPLLEKLRADEPVFGLMATIPSVPLAQILARAGFDFLVIDMEHSPIDIQAAQAMITATAGTRATPIVRVPWNLPWMVKHALDVGALGVTFPLVRTREEGERAARAMRYAPEGDRAWGPFHTHVRWGVSMRDYVAQANQAVFTEFLIEHVDAVRNLEEILETPGLDVAFLAPGDLSASLGVPGQLDHPRVRDCIAHAENVIRRSKVKMGGVTLDPAEANRMVDRGYRVVTLGFDFVLLERACAGLLQGVSA